MKLSNQKAGEGVGDKKQTKCMRGLHELVEGNLLFNKEGFRCCRLCNNANRRFRAEGKRWMGLIRKVGERRVKWIGR